MGNCTAAPFNHNIFFQQAHQDQDINCEILFLCNSILMII